MQEIYSIFSAAATIFSQLRYQSRIGMMFYLGSKTLLSTLLETFLVKIDRSEEKK